MRNLHRENKIAIVGFFVGLIAGASYGYFFGSIKGSGKVCATINKSSYWDGDACVVKTVVETPITK